MDLHIESRLSNRSEAGLIACDDCKPAYYCSDNHLTLFEACTSHPARTGMSARLIKEFMSMSLLQTSSSTGPTDHVLPTWTSLIDSRWEDEIQQELKKTYLNHPQFVQILPASIRAVSANLTLPMTILYALKLPDSTLAWTCKDRLTIHVSSRTDTQLLNPR
jgi:hypothetical protein